MQGEDRHSKLPGDGVVELTRVPPIEAEVIAARLRSAGIPATLGPDSVYPSLAVAVGVPVYVPAEDASRAEDLLGTDDPPE